MEPVPSKAPFQSQPAALPGSFSQMDTAAATRLLAEGWLPPEAAATASRVEWARRMDITDRESHRVQQLQATMVRDQIGALAREIATARRDIDSLRVAMEKEVAPRLAEHRDQLKEHRDLLQQERQALQEERQARQAMQQDFAAQLASMRAFCEDQMTSLRTRIQDELKTREYGETTLRSLLGEVRAEQQAYLREFRAGVEGLDLRVCALEPGHVPLARTTPKDVFVAPPSTTSPPRTPTSRGRSPNRQGPGSPGRHGNGISPAPLSAPPHATPVSGPITAQYIASSTSDFSSRINSHTGGPAPGLPPAVPSPKPQTRSRSPSSPLTLTTLPPRSPQHMRPVVSAVGSNGMTRGLTPPALTPRPMEPTRKDAVLGLACGRLRERFGGSLSTSAIHAAMNQHGSSGSAQNSITATMRTEPLVR